MIFSAKRIAFVVFSFLAFPSPSIPTHEFAQAQHPISQSSLPLDSTNPGEIQAADHDFTLRHIFHHGTYEIPQLHRRLDIRQDMEIWTQGDDEEDRQPAPTLHVRSRSQHIQRLVDRRLSAVESLLAAARQRGHAESLDADAWTSEDISGPNVTDKETILSFAKMTLDAYYLEPFVGDWRDVKGGFNYSQSFGWEADGLRGHIFADKDNSTIVIGLKGTSAVFDGAETTTNDKVNDNLFFSCCCAEQGHFLWRKVCDCRTKTYTCNQTCIVEALRDENRYYRASINLYGNVTELYPNSSVWLTGHSLGGSVGSLLGMTFGLPTVTFEAPGDALPATRLGLPAPPRSVLGAPQTWKYTGAYHFGHTADPVYMGTCNGFFSSCTIGGYAFESQCHTGYRCVYDTVGDKGWRVDIRTHQIINVISNVLEVYDTVPACEPDDECVDCSNWRFFESNRSTITTSTSLSSSTSTSRTRTSICKTPGWWGCLDKSTTSSSTSTTSISTTTTSCHSWGWFGCNDPTTTSSSSKSSTSTSQTTASCHSWGWFGCNDPTTTAEAAGPAFRVTAIPQQTAMATANIMYQQDL